MQFFLQIIANFGQDVLSWHIKHGHPDTKNKIISCKKNISTYHNTN